MLFVAIVSCVPERIKELAEFSKTRGSVKGIKIIGNYGTAVGKGITILEVDSEQAVFTYFTPTLRFFKDIEVHLALPMEKVMEFASLSK